MTDHHMPISNNSPPPSFVSLYFYASNMDSPSQQNKISIGGTPLLLPRYIQVTNLGRSTYHCTTFQTYCEEAPTYTIADLLDDSYHAASTVTILSEHQAHFPIFRILYQVCLTKVDLPPPYN
jgi:hypothetical protein